MARHYEDYTRRGATIAAIVVDTPAQNAAMVAKLALPFPVLADPGGAAAIRPYGVWDDARPIARPAIVILAPNGREVYRYAGADFMDRPGDDDLFAALERLRLPPAPSPAGGAPLAHLAPAPGPRALKLPDLGVYMRGVRFAMEAMAGRARDPFDRAEAERTATMAARFIAAQGATMRVTGMSARG